MNSISILSARVLKYILIAAIAFAPQVFTVPDACGARPAYGAAPEADAVTREISLSGAPVISVKGDPPSKYGDGRLAEFRGFADPCARLDHGGKILWLLYSWPHVRHMGGGPFDYTVGVETHLARSLDKGRSWEFVKALWPKTPARYPVGRLRIKQDGFISHEVPNFVPCIVDGKKSWVAARGDYFLGRSGNYKTRDNRSFCIRVTAAASPEELAVSPFITIGLTLNSKQCGVGVDLNKLSPDFPAVFIPMEPALYFSAGKLYLAFVCIAFDRVTQKLDKSFIAVISTEPRGSVEEWKWKYLGKLAASKEAAELGGESLTQIELAEGRDGKLLALMTPNAWKSNENSDITRDAFWGFENRGCVAVEVASVDPPSLQRTADGKLAVRAFLAPPKKGRGNGAAAYERACETGIIITLNDIVFGGHMVWSLHSTGVRP